MRAAPRSLFARTAVLIAVTILVFALIAWQAIIWTALVPGADATASLLTESARSALAARQSGASLPEGVRFESVDEDPSTPRYAGLAMRTYMARIENRIGAGLGATQVRVHRYAAPAELWVRVPQLPHDWLVLTWRLAGPGAPAATVIVLSAAALLTLVAAAISARRMAAPLAGLAAAAARLAQGERVEIDCDSGPSEVRSLAIAFTSMSHRLAELDEQRELLLGGLSHDLRTPLARLRVAVELLEKGDTALSQEITANIEEMDRMIGQFLHYARANYREAPARASLDEIARQTLAVYASDARVVLEPGAAAPRSFAIDSVRHMLLNLVQNALDYGKPPVTVRTRASATEIGLEVEDRGTGLSPSQWAQALEPFNRGERPSEGGHAGLGLSLVARLVEVSGGRLEGRQVAGGFRVSVALPAAG